MKKSLKQLIEKFEAQLSPIEFEGSKSLRKRIERLKGLAARFDAATKYKEVCNEQK